MRVIQTLFISCLILFLNGCAHYSAKLSPSINASRINKIFVENNLNDNHQIEHLLVAALKAQGKEALSGPPTMQPSEVDAVLRYQDYWNWDFSEHIIGLRLELRDSHKRKLLGSAQFNGPVSIKITPKEVVDRLIADLFKGS